MRYCGHFVVRTYALLPRANSEVQLAFVGGELDDPARNIPRVINVSMVIVVALSIFANVAYFSALSFDDIIQSTTIGLVSILLLVPLLTR